MPQLMAFPRALRTFLLLALVAVMALGGVLARAAAPLREHAPIAVAAVDLDDHGHSHDGDDEAAPGHTHHLGDHSHIVFGLPVTPGGLAPPIGTVLRWATVHVTLPAYASGLDRPPRTAV